jgi:AcrR family transcriptional regulator
LKAAADEFAERGFDMATIEGIAARVGILKGSVYHYVKSKEDLLFAVVEQPAKELLEYLSDLSVADISAADKLRALFRRQIGLFAEFYPAAFVYLGLIGRSSQPEVFRHRDSQYMELLEGILQEGADQGEFQIALEPRVTALAVVGILDWMQHWFTPRDQAQADALADALFSLAVGGLAAGAPVLEGLPEFEHISRALNRDITPADARAQQGKTEAE